MRKVKLGRRSVAGTLTSQTRRERRHGGRVRESRELVSHKKSEAWLSAWPPFLGFSESGGTHIPHLRQETYSASFLKPMARRFVGVPLVPFQMWVFQGSGWEERTNVTMLRDLAPLGRCSGPPGGLWLPSHTQPSALERSGSAGGDHRGPRAEWAGPASLHCPIRPPRLSPQTLSKTFLEAPDYSFHLR